MQNLTYMVNIAYSPGDLQGWMVSVVTVDICESSDDESPKPLSEKLDTIKAVGVLPPSSTELGFHSMFLHFLWTPGTVLAVAIIYLN